MDENNNNLVQLKKQIPNTYYQKKPAPMKPPESQYDILAAATSYPTAQAILVFKTGSTWYARNSVDGTIISSNSDFSTVMNAASAWISAGNAVVFIKDPGSDIIPTSTITYTNKEVFVTSDFATINTSALNNVCFLFQDTVQAGYKTCGISYFRLKGDQTHTNEIFAKFSETRAKVDNILCTDPATYYTFINLYGGNYLSHISNVQGRAIAPITIVGHGAGDTNTANGTCIDHCDLGYLAGSRAIDILKGDYIWVRDCWIEGVQTGIYADSVPNLRVTGCYIKGSVCGIDMTGCFYGQLHRNYLNILTASAIGIRWGTVYYGPLVSDNICYMGNVNNTIGIQMGYTENALLTGNHVLIDGGTPTGCVGIKGTSTQNWVAFTGNQLHNTSAITGTGMLFNNLTNCTVIGNLISNWSTPITITSRTTTLVDHDQGYKTENSGTSTGTGAQQTIAHGLAGTPTIVFIQPTASAATETGLTAASDGTNIYPTVTNAKTYIWYARLQI